VIEQRGEEEEDLRPDCRVCVFSRRQSRPVPAFISSGVPERAPGDRGWPGLAGWIKAKIRGKTRNRGRDWAEYRRPDVKNGRRGPRRGDGWRCSNTLVPPRPPLLQPEGRFSTTERRPATDWWAPPLLPPAAAPTNDGRSPCYHRPVAMLPPFAASATDRRRPCYHWPEALLLTGAAPATNGRQLCYHRLPPLLPSAGGSAIDGAPPLLPPVSGSAIDGRG
jgi:hypothetical protein